MISAEYGLSGLLCYNKSVKFLFIEGNNQLYLPFFRERFNITAS